MEEITSKRLTPASPEDENLELLQSLKTVINTHPMGRALELIKTIDAWLTEGLQIKQQLTDLIDSINSYSDIGIDTSFKVSSDLPNSEPPEKKDVIVALEGESEHEINLTRALEESDPVKDPEVKEPLNFYTVSEDPLDEYIVMEIQAKHDAAIQKDPQQK